MITNILNPDGNKRGHMEKRDSAVIQPIFATANMAIRREALKEVGPFDTNCRTGEDVDLSIRLSKTRWGLFFEPRAIIRHKHRATLLGLLKQWYHYGKYHPYIFKKHSKRAVEIYYQGRDGSGWASIKFSEILGVPVPLSAVFFLTPFYTANLFYLIIAALLVLKLYWLAAAAAAGRLLFELFSFETVRIVRKRRVFRWAAYSFIKYLLNWTYVAGGFLGGLRIGVLYFDATRDTPPTV